MANLRDALILQDFTAWIEGVGKIGECPSFQLPEINLQVEDFRGGGMDGTVEIAHGLEKIEMQFELHTWDRQVWEKLGFGPGAADVPFMFMGYTLTANKKEAPVWVRTKGMIKSIKPERVESGRKFRQTVHVSAHQYKHAIDNQIVTDIDVYAKKFFINGEDVNRNARRFLGIN